MLLFIFNLHFGQELLSHAVFDFADHPVGSQFCPLGAILAVDVVDDVFGAFQLLALPLVVHVVLVVFKSLL